ncbi:MAG: DUF1460 domain-containing protein [Planctomycetes bacterium]|nr:DUF1460 domain-containing protein [Planctomycetota bacterium]
MQSRRINRQKWQVIIGSFTACTVTAAVASTTHPSPTKEPSISDLKPLHEMTLPEFARYIDSRSRDGVRAYDSVSLGKEVEVFALQSLGTPFQMSASIFDLASADCVTFTERCLAAACASDWNSFYRITLRIRHSPGSLSFLDRNFFPLTDWVPNNSWLIEDLTNELQVSTVPFEYVVRPKAFFAKLTFGEDDTPLGKAKTEAKAKKIALAPEKIVHHDQYVPAEGLGDVSGQIATGDIWLSIRTRQAPGLRPWYDCDHMGILRKTSSGLVLIHSAPPAVKQELVSDFLSARPWVKGFKILRLPANARELATKEVARLAVSVADYAQVPSPESVEAKVKTRRPASEAGGRAACALTGGSSRTGNGCCDVEPPECDHFVYTYDTNCVGSCPAGMSCIATAQSNVLVYVDQDCYGNCNVKPNGCTLGESEIVYADEPTDCDCLKSASAP